MDTYSSGTKVRVNAGRGFREPYSDIWQYENLTGEIESSTTVTWHQIRSWERESNSPSEVVQVYKIRLDIGIEADNVIEECLEGWNALASSVDLMESGAQETRCPHNKVQGVERSNS